MSHTRQDLLSPAQRFQVMALPASLREYGELDTLTPADLEFIAAHRTHSNRLGVAMQLCFLRYPGRAWTCRSFPPPSRWPGRPWAVSPAPNSSVPGATVATLRIAPHSLPSCVPRPGNAPGNDPHRHGRIH
ncbi:MAG: DUF4158 domain-containing protein [Bryobacteraceae bacterium]